MSVITPPVVPVNQPVSDVKPDTDNLEFERPPVDGDDLLSDLPQGALALMSQILPLRQDTLKLATSDNRAAVVGAGKFIGEDSDITRRAAALSRMGVHSELSRAPVDAAKNVVPVPAITTLVGLKTSAPVLPVSPASPPSALTTPDYLPVTPIANVVAALEHSSLLSNQAPALEAESKDRQLQFMPVPGPLEKSQPLPTPVQTPVAAHQPLGDHTFKMPADVRKGTEGYLKIPFSKGETVGQVIINKPSAEAPQQLLLSTNNFDVSSLLRDSVQQLHEPRWRLVDPQSDQSGQGQGSSKQDADEGTNDGFGRGPEPQEVEA